MPSPVALIKKRRWLLFILVPLATSGAGLFVLMRMRAGDPGLVAAEIAGDIVAGRSIASRNITDDRGKPLTNAQKDRLCFDVLHPPFRGKRIISEQIVNYKQGTGEVKAILVDEKGQQSVFMLSTVKAPEGVVIRTSTLLRPTWEYLANPTAAANLGWTEKTKLKAPFVRQAAPLLESIGITELMAEDGEFYPVSELAGVYEAWE